MVYDVEVEQETCAPPPKKNPGSAPCVGNERSGVGSKWHSILHVNPAKYRSRLGNELQRQDSSCVLIEFKNKSVPTPDVAWISTCQTFGNAYSGCWHRMLYGRHEPLCVLQHDRVKVR